MSTRFSTKFGLSLFYLVSTIALEIMTFCLLDIGFLPKNFLYDFGLMLMFMGIIFIIPNYLAQYIVSMVILVIQFVLMYVNYSLYHLYGDVFSFDMIRLFNETKQAITSDFTYIWLIVFLVALAIVLGVIGFFIYKSLRVYKIPFHKNFSVFIIMVVMIVQGLGLSVYTQQSIAMSMAASITDEDYVLSDAFLRDTTMMKIASLKSLGTYGYYVNNLMNLLSNSSNKAVIEQATKYFKAGETFDENSSNVFGVDEGNNVLVVMMESLEWYGFSDGTYNSYTFSEELTPNIYNLMQEGFIATDFFSKSKTNISEGIGILGSYPIGKFMSQVATSDKRDYYGFSLPNMLKDLGYETGFYHGYNSSFYDRNQTHKNLGFDHLYFGDDALDSSVEWKYFPKEADFVYSAIEEADFIPEGKKFYNFYTTLTTHGAYDDKTSAEREDNRAYVERVRNSNWFAEVKNAYKYSTIEYLLNYQAAVVGLDEAIGVMVNRLKELNIYDDTTIILYSDHNAYYHGLTNSLKGVASNDYSNTELNTVPLIIKSAGLNEAIEEKGYYGYDEYGHYASTNNQDGVRARPDRYGNTVKGTTELLPSTSRFCSAYDLVPTLLDLLGIEYNKNFYPGNSLFADIPEKIQVYDSMINLNVIDEEIVVYYSHTGGLFGKYGNTYDMDEYDFSYPGGVTYGNYASKFKLEAKRLLLKLNFISTLYSYGVYTKI